MKKKNCIIPFNFYDVSFIYKCKAQEPTENRMLNTKKIGETKNER